MFDHQLNCRGRVSDAAFYLIKEWHSQRVTISEIARSLKIARSTVRFHVNAAHPPSRRAKPLPPGVSAAKAAEIKRRRRLVDQAAAAKEIITRKAKRSTRTYVRKLYPSPQAIAQYLRTRGFNVSATTVRRDLLAVGYHARRRRVVPYLNSKMKEARVHACQEMLTANSTLKLDINRLLFSDEKRFDSDDHTHCFDWVKEGDLPIGREHDTNATKVMVWGVIGVNFRHLVILKDGGINAVRYQQECLRPALGALRAPGVVFMQDNARPHSCESTKRYLRRHGVEVLAWPPYSPDLNPIENLWAYLSKRVSTVAPFGGEKLEAAIIAEWNAIPQFIINNLVVSFERRVKECIRVGGAATRL
jgi:transposase